MRFTWDPEKRKTNLTRHGFDFNDAQRIFQGLFWTFEDTRVGYGERRYAGYGLLEGIVVALAFTEHADETVRIITMRKATSHERRDFYDQIRD